MLNANINKNSVSVECPFLIDFLLEHSYDKIRS